MVNLTKGYANQSVSANETLYAVESTGIPHKKNSMGKSPRKHIEIHFHMIGELIGS
jgi:hypothetical protein